MAAKQKCPNKKPNFQPKTLLKNAPLCRNPSPRIGFGYTLLQKPENLRWHTHYKMPEAIRNSKGKHLETGKETPPRRAPPMTNLSSRPTPTGRSHSEKCNQQASGLCLVYVCSMLGLCLVEREARAARAELRRRLGVNDLAQGRNW